MTQGKSFYSRKVSQFSSFKYPLDQIRLLMSQLNYVTNKRECFLLYDKVLVPLFRVGTGEAGESWFIFT